MHSISHKSGVTKLHAAMCVLQVTILYVLTTFKFLELNQHGFLERGSKESLFILFLWP
jgi:hypothetical protein